MRPSSSRLRQASLATLSGFFAILLVEHLLRGLDPAQHMISEYANGPFGWLMTVGFSLWSASLALAAAPLMATGNSVSDRRMSLCFAAAAVGLLLVAIFHTQTVAGELPEGQMLTLTGRLHDLGSAAAFVALLLALLLDAARSRKDRGYVWLLAGLIGVAVSSNTGLLVSGDPVPGARQRLVVACACAWQVAFLVRRSGQARAR